MKSTAYLKLFIGMQLLFVIAHIYKENRYIKIFYQQQRLEHTREELRAHRQQLLQRLQQLQNQATVSTFAQKNLHLQKVPLSSVRHLHE